MKYTSKGPLEKGYNKMVSAVENPEMMGMEFGVVKMAAGDVLHFDYAQEVVYDLLSGDVTFEWDGKLKTVARRDCFHEGAVLLHVPQNTAVTISCLTDAEVAVARTENARAFEARLLHPEDCLCANEERGANLSKGGRTIIALHSTTADESVSKIVNTITTGGPVTTSRCDVGYIVTEYGVANLRGQTLRERAKRLIAIAHPKFRAALAEEYERRFSEKLAI